MNLNQFYNEVSRHTDTAGSEINVAETKRVLAVSFQLLAAMPAAECNDLLAKALVTASKKKALPSKPAATKKKKASRKKSVKK